MVGALLIVARTFLRPLGLPHPTTAQILAATGAKSSRAHELAARIRALLDGLVGPVGRPKKPEAFAPPTAPATLTQTVLGFLMRHPGAVAPGFYAEVFKKLILEQREAHADLDLATFAAAVAVPRGTIEDWHRAASSTAAAAPRPPADDPAASAHIQSVIVAYRSWHGTFVAFCNHLREHLRIDYGRTFIANILETYGERRPDRRRGRGPDERASRDSFQLYFPGAQWVGDGMEVNVTVNGERFRFNLELDVDAASGAIVGASIRDEEDGAAVVEAIADGVATTGGAPIALLLDNRPSNHTHEVYSALEEAKSMMIRSTPGRGQNKAPVEGMFGLFSQDAPPIDVNAATPRELAKELLRLRVQTWARRKNHRPRTRRRNRGKTSVELYAESKPSEDQIADARAKLEELRRKQEKARATRIARADPAMLTFLDAAFERLGLSDPDRHIRASIAGFTRDAIVDGVATFEAKRQKGTLPQGADGRYLLGIVRNIQHTHEADAITDALLRHRLELRDALLAPLTAERDDLFERTSITNQLRAMVDRAMAAERQIDRRFWLGAAADRVAAQPVAQHPGLLRAAARRIHASFKIPTRERAEAERILIRSVLPIS